MVFLIFGFVILLTAALLLAAGGSFWAWMTVGALVIIGGLGLVIVLARRNRAVGGQ